MSLVTNLKAIVERVTRTNPPAGSSDSGASLGAQVGAGAGESSRRATGMQTPSLAGLGAQRGGGQPVPAGFGAGAAARMDDSMEALAGPPAHSALLGSSGSPDPTNSYGSGNQTKPFMSNFTSGIFGHGKSSSGGASQGPRSAPTAQSYAPRRGFLPGASAQMTGLTNPAKPNLPASTSPRNQSTVSADFAKQLFNRGR